VIDKISCRAWNGFSDRLTAAAIAAERAQVIQAAADRSQSAYGGAALLEVNAVHFHGCRLANCWELARGRLAKECKGDDERFHAVLPFVD